MTALPRGATLLPIQLGRYQILKQLASGSVADVLIARAGGLEGFARHVVIKRLRPEMASEERVAKAFLEEARIAGSLHHQNIVTVHDIGEQDGAYFFAMEYVHGEDARKLIGKVRDRGEHIPLEHALSIVMATAAGLHHAHEQAAPNGDRLGLVHRDIAPANILIGYDGSVKIVDFGMAKAVSSSQNTMTGLLKGKASYMSPEQCAGKPIDRRTDIFALGIVLYELITAQRLFKGVNDFMTMAAIVEGEIPRPSTLRREVPGALDAIILRALERSPESRYQTAEAMRESIEAFALSQELRTSHKALADYLTGLFGHRPEPWEAGAANVLDVHRDDESTYANGLVPAPAAQPRELLARLAPRDRSPMMQAEAADGEWGEDDENVRTEAVGRSLAANRGAREPNQAKTSPTATVPADSVFGGVTVTGGPSITGQTLVDTTVTGVDIPPAEDTGGVASKLNAAAATRAGRGDDLESRTVVEPPVFDTSTGAQAEDEDFVDEAATEATTGDDPPWMVVEARATSKAVVPRANLAKKAGTAVFGAPTPAVGARQAAPPALSEPPSGAPPPRPTPPTRSAAALPPAPASRPTPPSLVAPKPTPPPHAAAAPPPRSLPAPHRAAAATPPAFLGGSAAGPSPATPEDDTDEPTLEPGAPTPADAPTLVPSAPRAAPSAPRPAPSAPRPPSAAAIGPLAAPAPELPPLQADVRGGVYSFVVKHQTRIWIAGGIALVLLVILAARGCGDDAGRGGLRGDHAAEHEGP